MTKIALRVCEEFMWAETTEIKFANVLVLESWDVRDLGGMHVSILPHQSIQHHSQFICHLCGKKEVGKEK